ncbi:unnamed protein product, partial [Musa acuminata subsp. burmannicoides]
LISPAVCEVTSPFLVDPWRPPLDLRALRHMRSFSASYMVCFHQYCSTLRVVLESPAC